MTTIHLSPDLEGYTKKELSDLHQYTNLYNISLSGFGNFALNVLAEGTDESEAIISLMETMEIEGEQIFNIQPIFNIEDLDIYELV